MLCIRGAITVDCNEKAEILHKTTQMLQAIIEENKLEIPSIRCILFTATRDLDAAYPAVAARGLGITLAALMCVQEMYVEGSLPSCIRVTVMAEGETSQAKLRHVYLDGAKVLRKDLVNQTEAER